MKLHRFFFSVLSVSFLTVLSCQVQNPRSIKETNLDECVQENWLTIYRKNDDVLFLSDENQIDTYTEIKELLLSGDIRLWYKRRNNSDWMTSPLPETVRDSILYNDSSYYNLYFDYQSEGDIPMKNSKGGDSIRPYPSGGGVYIYPPHKYEPITLDLVTEIRIKENRIYDSISNDYYLKPVMVAFDVFTWKHNISFWVKVDDLDKHMQINRSWINHITEQKYHGFVYQRRSCNDPDYKHKIIYPTLD